MFQTFILTGYLLGIFLFTGCHAQSSEDSLRTVTEFLPTSTRDPLLPESTSFSFAAPSGTGQPCARIANAVESAIRFDRVAVPAELAYECLTSVPVGRTEALGTIDALLKMVQFQSNLAYLRDPPEGYENPPVDIIAGLEDIRNRASSNEYSNQFDFEAAIATLLNSARDGHLGFDGPTFASAVAWRRDFATVLVSVTLDDGPARVYNAVDLNTTVDASPVSQIDGVDVQEFLQTEADRLPYHDPDTRWNAMFYRQAGQTYGSFIGPQWYPGPTTTVLFDNGTEQTYTNRAILVEPSLWSLVSDGESFYNTFVVATGGRKARRELTMLSVPQRLQPFRPSSDDNNAAIPVGFPEPYVTGPGEVYINGYFLDTPTIPNLAVLSMQTFYTETNEQDEEFQVLIQDFLAQARTRGSERIIIDVQSNPGGSVFLGYDAFRQFFPDIEPYGGNRFRGHEAANLFGEEVNRLPSSQIGDLNNSPFRYPRFISASNEPFTSWSDMYEGPSQNGDSFTETLRYNLSDPTLTFSSFGEGITVTGYQERSDPPESPFAPEDIIIVSDGLCGSTCALFIEFMTLQAGVRVIALGGRPQNGPMQPVGGTKGSNVLPAEYFQALAELLIFVLASTEAEARDWISILPEPFPIITGEATVNFLDNIREDDETMTPTQFTNETANCRLWLTPDMARDITQLWTVVAEVAWGSSDGGIDEGRCVPGSFRQASLLEEPPVPPANSGSDSGTDRGTDGDAGSSGSTGAAAALDVRWGMAILVAFAVGAACF